MTKIIIYSTRFGGPYQQYRLLKRYFEHAGYRVKLYHTAWAMLMSVLFEKKSAVISIVPLPIRFGATKYILNIKGDVRAERHIIRNPLAYLYPLAMRAADAVVVPSEFLRRRLELDAQVIPNAAPRLAGCAPKAVPVRIMTATSFAFRDKALGVVQIAKALAALEPETELTFDIFGSGIFGHEVKRKIGELRFHPRMTVRFRGHSSRISEELRASDLFLYWSEHDNMPNAVIEAMAAGVPVICNDVGAIREVVRDGQDAIISDAGKLVADIRRLLQSPDLRRALGVRGRRRVRNLLGPASIARQWLELIES